MKEEIDRLKNELGISKDLDNPKLVDYLKDNYGLIIKVYGATKDPSKWEELVGLKGNVITEDFQEYEKYEDALEAAITESMAFISLYKLEKINPDQNS